LVVTENEALIQRILEEKSAMTKFCNIVDFSTFLRADYHVPRWIKTFSRVFRRFF